MIGSKVSPTVERCGTTNTSEQDVEVYDLYPQLPSANESVMPELIPAPCETIDVQETAPDVLEEKQSVITVEVGYAPYEPTAINRLAGRHGTSVDEVDELLRAGIFVDLTEWFARVYAHHWKAIPSND
jgi:hypothetical protein